MTRRELAAVHWGAFQIQVNERAIERALRNKTAAGFVAHAGGTRFQLLPPGVARAEGIAPPYGGESRG